MARNGCAPEQHAGKGDNAETQGASLATSFSTEDGELEAQEKLKGLWNGCHAQETQCAMGGKKKNQSVGDTGGVFDVHSLHVGRGVSTRA